MTAIVPCDPLVQGWIAVILVLAYLGMFSARLTDPAFRDDFLDWMTWRDPLGVRFWKRNSFFGLATLAFLGTFGLLAALTSAYCP